MKRFFMIALVALADLGAQQILGPNGMNATSAMLTYTLDTSTKEVTYSFVTPVDAISSLSEARVYVTAITGSPTVTCGIYSSHNENGRRDSLLESSADVSLPGSPPGFADCTGFTYATSTFTRYWIVLKCSDCDGSTKAVTFAAGPDYSIFNGLGSSQNSSFPNWGWMYRSYTGASWGTQHPNSAGLRLKFGSLYLGQPITGYGAISGALIYSANEYGVSFTADYGANWPVSGIVLSATKTGNPSGNLRAKLYLAEGATGTLLAISAGIPGNAVCSTCWQADLLFPISPAVILTQGRTYYAVLDDSATDSSGNAFKLNGATWDTDSGSLSLKPMGTCLAYTTSGTDTVGNTATFSTTCSTVPQFNVVLANPPAKPVGMGFSIVQ